MHDDVLGLKTWLMEAATRALIMVGVTKSLIERGDVSKEKLRESLQKAIIEEGLLDKMNVSLNVDTLMKMLEEDFGIYFTEAFQTIEASFASQEVADKLKIPSGSPILTVVKTMYTRKRKPVSLSQILYRGDLFKYIAFTTQSNHYPAFFEKLLT